MLSVSTNLDFGRSSSWNTAWASRVFKSFLFLVKYSYLVASTLTLSISAIILVDFVSRFYAFLSQGFNFSNR